MNITKQNISAKDEFCDVCGRPAKMGVHIEAMDDMGLLNDGLPGLSFLKLEAVEEIDFDIFLCRDHDHLATDKAIEDRADYLFDEV